MNDQEDLKSSKEITRRIELDYEVKQMQEAWEKEKIKFEHDFWRRKQIKNVSETDTTCFRL